MNKGIIKKAIIVAIIITVFSIIITGWIDYQKHKDYEAMKGDMIQSVNKQSQDTSLVKLDIVKESITNTGVTMIITDHNKNPYGWGPGYELLKLVNDEQWIPVDALVPLSFHEIAYVLDENNQYEYKIDWTNFYGAVPSGMYKLKKSVYDDGYVDIYTEAFEIK